MQTEKQNNFAVNFANLWRAKDELRIKNIRKNSLSYLLLMPMAIMLSDIEYWGYDMTLFGFDSYLQMSLAYALGWLVSFFLPKKILPSCFRIFAMLTAFALFGLIFIPQNYFFVVCMLLFHMSTAVCTALGFFVFAFRLNNAERFFAMLFIALYYGITGLTWFMWNMDFVYKFLVAPVFMVILLVGAFRCREDTFALKSEHPKEKNGGSYMVFFIFILYFVLEALFSSYYEIWTEDMFTYYGIASIVAVPLVYLIHTKLRAGIWHSWNLYFIFPIIGMGFFVSGNISFFSIGSFCCGLGSNIGYVAVMYIIGCFGKRRSSYGFFRTYCQVAFLLELLSPLIFSNIYNVFSDGFAFITLCIMSAMLLLNLFLSPLLFKQIFDTKWAAEFKTLDMTILTEKVEHTDRLENLKLSPREKAVATLLLRGLTMRQISVDLGIAESTVNGYCGTLYKKLNINSRMELLIRFGLTDDNES